MAVPAQKFREIVLLALYSTHYGPSEEKELTAMIMKELSVTKNSVRLAIQRAQEILEKKESIEKLITTTAKSYTLARIQLLEKTVLLLCLYEMLYDEAIPEKVAIAEGIRLSRKFSTPESATFVNAILDECMHKEKRED